MRELAPEEIDLVSAGPSAPALLPISDLNNRLVVMPALTMPGDFLAAGAAVLSHDRLGINK